MPAIKDLNDLFSDLLKDIYYAEKKILKALPKMAKAAGKDSQLAEAFQNHQEETVGQVDRLEQVFRIIGKKPQAKKCDAIEGINREAEDMMSNINSKPVLQAGLLAGAQAIEHYEMARYGTLIEWARLLGHDDAAELLEETLEQEKKCDELLTDLAKDQINEAALGEMQGMEEEDEESEEDSSEMRGPQRRRAA